MAFLTQEDYKRKIKDHRLQMILDGEVNLLSDISEDAESTVADYLNALYDVEAIFGKLGAERDRNVLRWTLNIATYFLYDLVEDVMMPERVEKDYDDTLRHLTNIADAKISAILPRRQTDEGKPVTKFRWGSGQARSH
jgi:phage gp36-like protein